MWLFTPAAKNDIIVLFNDNQQRLELRRLLNQDFNRRNREIDFLNFFLNRNKFNLILNIRRDHLIEDTLNEVSKPDMNFQTKLKVKFAGEQGVDDGECHPVWREPVRVCAAAVCLPARNPKQSVSEAGWMGEGGGIDRTL